MFVNEYRTIFIYTYIVPQCKKHTVYNLNIIICVHTCSHIRVWKVRIESRRVGGLNEVVCAFVYLRFISITRRKHVKQLLFILLLPTHAATRAAHSVWCAQKLEKPSRTHGMCAIWIAIARQPNGFWLVCALLGAHVLNWERCSLLAFL